MNGRLALAALSACACAAGANAQMMGNNLTAEWHHPSFGVPIESHTMLVHSGIELTADDIVNDFKFAIDIGDNTVSFAFNTYSSWSVTDFNGWYFMDVDGTLPEITGYALESYSGSGTLVIDAGWTADSYYANFAGTVVEANDVIVMRVTFVPAPGAISLLGVCGLPIVRRRR